MYNIFVGSCKNHSNGSLVGSQPNLIVFRFVESKRQSIENKLSQNAGQLERQTAKRLAKFAPGPLAEQSRALNASQLLGLIFIS